MSNILCKICQAPATHEFDLPILSGKYIGKYYRCEYCECLFIANTCWLEDAYKLSSLTSIDVSVAQRTLHNYAALRTLHFLLGIKTILDWGCSSGFTVRLLRDSGIEAYGIDKYAKEKYPGVLSPKNVKINLISAFEVLEHLESPVDELGEILTRSPDYFFFSTQRYSTEQKKDWSYLDPEHGQHIFFYSDKTLNILGEKFGYKVFNIGSFGLLYKPNISFFKKNILRVLINNKALRIQRAIYLALPSRGTWRDR
jgi:hypothetical protein